MLVLASRNRMKLTARDDAVNHAILQGGIRLQYVVAVYIACNFVDWLTCSIGQNLVERLAHAQNLPSVDIDVRRLSAKSAHRRLVDENAGMGKTEAFALCSAGQ